MGHSPKKSLFSEAKTRCKGLFSSCFSPADVRVVPDLYAHVTFFWLNAHPVCCMCVCSVSRCTSGSHRLLCVSEEPGVQDTMLPMWPSGLFLLYPTVLQLLQPLLLCLHNHRVSPNLISFSLHFPKGSDVLEHRHAQTCLQPINISHCSSLKAVHYVVGTPNVCMSFFVT